MKQITLKRKTTKHVGSTYNAFVDGEFIGVVSEIYIDKYSSDFDKPGHISTKPAWQWKHDKNEETFILLKTAAVDLATKVLGEDEYNYEQVT